jgi:hypothetical protein
MEVGLRRRKEKRDERGGEGRIWEETIKQRRGGHDRDRLLNPP